MSCARRPRAGAIHSAVPVVVPPLLSGADLVDFIARNAALQRQRWVDVYKRLWERKAKIDVVDTVLVVDGCVSDWFFTSSVSGELQRKPDADVTLLAIKRHFVRASVGARGLARHLARLVLHDGGDTSYTLLTDLEFNLVLGQRASPLWQAGFLLQPLVAWPPQASPPTPDAARATFVAKYSALTAATCTRVLQLGPGELYELSPSPHSGLAPPASATTGGSGSLAPAPAPTSSARMRRARDAGGELARGLEEIVRGELRRLVQELERAFRDPLRLLTAEYQATPTLRLVLVRVSGIVFASDLAPARRRPARSSAPPARPQSAPAARKSSVAASNRCAGRAFCGCTGVATALKAALPLPSARRELQQITRRSVSLSEEESAYLARFGAEAEAALTARRARRPAAAAAVAEDGATARLLQRRLFMLRNTLWNPQSDAFSPKIMEFQDSQRLPQQYEMVAVCRTCYLIYHAIDVERFQVAQATAKAAAARTSAIYASRLIASEQAALSAAASRDQRQRRGALATIPASMPQGLGVADAMDDDDDA